MTSFISKIISWFKGPTDEEMYERGQNLVDNSISSIVDPSVREVLVENLFSISLGEFNETSGQVAYDKGINDRLRELGFESPY